MTLPGRHATPHACCRTALPLLLILIRSLWLTLLRDRMALLLTFVLPCLLFSVFAFIFGGMETDGGTAKPLRLVIVDLDQSRLSERITATLHELPELQRVQLPAAPLPATGSTPATADSSSARPPAAARHAADADAASAAAVLRQAADRILRGQADAAVVFPVGLEQSFGQFGQDRAAVEVLYDAANPLARQMLTGLLQAAAMTSAPDILLEQGLRQLAIYGGPLTAVQRVAVEQLRRTLQSTTATTTATAGQPVTPAPAKQRPPLSMADGLLRVRTTAALELAAVPQPHMGGRQQPQGSMIAYYAAGIAVMFLMFSMTGAAGALLEHQENGTLERLLTGQLSVQQLLLAHWLYAVCLGIVQTSLMLVFAAAVFGLDLWHGSVLAGSLLLTVVSAMASAAFALVLATSCRTRRQLEGVSSLVVLMLSAFGGSMVPRFVMPVLVQQTSRLTFNGWALDGYLKVFWYRVPGESIVLSILPEVGIILLWAILFMAIALRLAGRWAVS